MVSVLRPALVLLALFTVLTGLIYPAVVTGAAQGLFPKQANGSILEKNGFGGSMLVAQPFDDPKYFWGRPSATAPFPTNAAASTGSNQGPSSEALRTGQPLRGQVLGVRRPGQPPLWLSANAEPVRVAPGEPPHGVVSTFALLPR